MQVDTRIHSEPAKPSRKHRIDRGSKGSAAVFMRREQELERKIKTALHSARSLLFRVPEWPIESEGYEVG